MNAKKKWKWGPDEQKAFKEKKTVISQETLLAFPDFTKPFHIYTDALDPQMGAVIMQEGKPVAYFSMKLNKAQHNYTVMEKELLSIVTVLNKYCSMLFGVHELHTHTDHENLTYANLNSQWVLRWRLFLEEYNPIFHFIEGTANTLADALSWYPLQNRKTTLHSWSP